MKITTTTTTLFKMVLVFTLLFSAFLALTITYNRVFKLKNESISILEKYEGTTNAVGIINNYLKNSGYTTKGRCDSDGFGVNDYDNSTPQKVRDGETYYYCFNYHCDKPACNIGDKDNKIYYEIKLFYNFNIPILGDFATFKITGETKAVKLYSESQKY